MQNKNKYLSLIPLASLMIKWEQEDAHVCICFRFDRSNFKMVNGEVKLKCMFVSNWKFLQKM